MTVDPPRDAATRKRDVLHRLDTDIDAWVPSADLAGNAYLVPLSFLWDGASLTMATLASSVTARNLRRAGTARLAIGGQTRDVILVDGPLIEYAATDIPDVLAEAFAAKLWDARKSAGPYTYFCVTPQRIQAWREENELTGRTLMRNGAWLI